MTYSVQAVEQHFLSRVSPSYTIHHAYRDIALTIGHSNIKLALSYIDKISTEVETASDIDHNKEKLYLGGIYMRLGILEKAWPLYRYRTQDSIYNSLKSPFEAHREWKGGNIRGKTLCIILEQGIGDCIMWARYLPMISGAHIHLYVPYSYWKKIIPLLDKVLRICAGKNKLTITDTVIEHSYWCFLADLTDIFKVTLKNWPKFYPYINVTPNKVQHWQQRLASYRMEGRLLIGLNASGFDGASDVRRITKTDLLPILDRGDIAYINLNIAHTIDHRNVISFKDIDQETAFLDTAAIMRCVDHVLTVDTAIAHIAGAMNVPTTLLLTNPAEWRWFLHLGACPWYPSVSYYRQPKPGVWDINAHCLDDYLF